MHDITGKSGNETCIIISNFYHILFDFYNRTDVLGRFKLFSKD
jgi:hypothetical protein